METNVSSKNYPSSGSIDYDSRQPSILNGENGTPTQAFPNEYDQSSQRNI